MKIALGIIVGLWLLSRSNFGGGVGSSSNIASVQAIQPDPTGFMGVGTTTTIFDDNGSFVGPIVYSTPLVPMATTPNVVRMNTKYGRGFTF